MTKNKTAGALPPKTGEPLVSAELIAWLEKTYPDIALDLSLPPREADARFGEIRLVRKLKAMHANQVRPVLQGS